MLWKKLFHTVEKSHPHRLPFGALRAPLPPPHGCQQGTSFIIGLVPAVRRTWCRGFRLDFAGVSRKNNRRIFR
jgi:hypothetical protein